MNTFAKYLATLAASATIAAAATAHASSITVAGSGIDADGHAAAASAVFTISNGQINITLTNTTASTISAGDLLTGVSFVLHSGATATSESSASAADVIGFPQKKNSSNVVDYGSQNLLALGQWQLKSGAANTLTWNNGDGPDYGILGPGPYASTNSSIVGNKPHNPYINQQATFTLLGAGITGSDYVTEATFYFGTAFTPAFTVTPPPPAVPLPAAATSGLALLAGLGMVAGLRKKLAL